GELADPRQLDQVVGQVHAQLVSDAADHPPAALLVRFLRRQFHRGLLVTAAQKHERLSTLSAIRAAELEKTYGTLGPAEDLPPIHPSSAPTVEIELLPAMPSPGVWPARTRALVARRVQKCARSLFPA